MDAKEKNELLLAQLIFMFQSAAMQQLGKLKSPFSDKIERDLGQARISIDMLEMIHNRMKGNLTSDEEAMFTRVLQELRLNYVDEVAKVQQEGPGTTQAAASEPPAEPKGETAQ